MEKKKKLSKLVIKKEVISNLSHRSMAVIRGGYGSECGGDCWSDGATDFWLTNGLCGCSGTFHMLMCGVTNVYTVCYTIAK